MTNNNVWLSDKNPSQNNFFPINIINHFNIFHDWTTPYSSRNGRMANRRERVNKYTTYAIHTCTCWCHNGNKEIHARFINTANLQLLL